MMLARPSFQLRCDKTSQQHNSYKYQSKHFICEVSKHNIPAGLIDVLIAL